MSKFLNLLSDIVITLREKNPEKILKLVRELLNTTDVVLSKPAIAELKLIRACAYAANNEDSPARKGFEDSMKLFKEANLRLHFMRAGLFLSRFLIKAGQLKEAENLLGNLGGKKSVTNDPYLSCLYAYCRAELRFQLFEVGKIQINWLTDELEKLHTAAALLDYPGLGSECHLLLSGKINPTELLLNIHCKTGNYKKALPLIQSLKSKSIRRKLHFNGASWDRIDPQERIKIKNLGDNFATKIEEYISLMFLVYPFMAEFKQHFHFIEGKPGEIFRDVKILFEKYGLGKFRPDEFKIRMADVRESLFNTRKEYLKYVDNASLVSPVNNYYFTSTVSHVSKIIALIDEKTLVLDYYFSKDSLFISAIHKKGVKIQRIGKKQSGVANLIDKLIDLTKFSKDSKGKGSSHFDQGLAALYEVLIEPVSLELEDKDKVYIIPHNSLFRVPYSILKKTGGDALSRCEVSILPSMIYLLKMLSISEVVLNSEGIIEINSKENDAITGDDPLSKWKLQSLNRGAAEKDQLEAELPLKSINTASMLLFKKGLSYKKMEKDFYQLLGDNNSINMNLSLPEHINCPTVLMCPCITYPAESESDTPGDPLNNLINFSFFMGTKVFVHNIWNVPGNISWRFSQILSEELKGKKLLEAFKKAKNRVKSEFGNDVSIVNAFQLIGANLQVEIFKGAELESGNNVTIEKLISPEQKLLSSPVIMEGMIFTGGEDKEVTAYNSTDGSILWNFKTMDWINNPFTCRDGTLYVGAMDKRVFSVEGRTGRKKWEFKTGGWIADSPVVNKDCVFALSKDGYLYILNRESGEMKKRHFVGGITRGECHLDAFSLLIVNEHRDKLKLFCFDSKRHNLLWEKNLPFKARGRGTTQKGCYYSISSDGTLRSFSLKNGKLNWKSASQVRFSGKLLVDGNLAYIKKTDSDIHAVSLENGETKWTIKPPAPISVPPLIYQNRLCMYCNDGFLYGYNKSNGELIMRVLLGKLPAEEIIESDNNLYFYSPENGVYRVHLQHQMEMAIKGKADIIEIESASILFSTARIDRMGLINLDLSDLKNSDPSTSTQGGSSGEVILCSPMVLTDGAIVCKKGGRIENLDLETFTTSWGLMVKDDVRFPPVKHKGAIIAGGDQGYLYSINSKTGELLSENKITRNITSALCVGKKNIFFGSSDKHLYCASFYQGKVKWKFRTGGVIKSRPVVFRKNIIFASGDGNLYCVECETGKPVWQEKTLSHDAYDLILKDNMLYMAGTDSYLYCINPINGKVIWKYFCLGEDNVAPPLVSNNLIVFVTNKGTIFILGRNKGNLIRKIRITEQSLVSPVEYKNEFILGTVKGHIIFFDKNKGNITRSYDLKAPVEYDFEIVNKKILVVEGKNSVTCIPLEEEKKTAAAASPQNGNSKTNTNRQPGKGMSQETLQGNPRKNAAVSQPGAGRARKGGSGNFVPAILIMLGLVSLGIFSLISENIPLLIFSVLSFIVTLVITNVYRLQRENVEMKRLFNRFVPSHLLNKFVKEGKTEEKEITVLFMDLYDYTSISEAISNTELFELIKKIDSLTDRVVSLYKGEIMSYIGDAYMITFNAVNNVPDHPQKAVSAAMEINREVEKISKTLKLPGQGDVPLKLKMGFGIHTGNAMVGIRGGQNKLEPFVLGDTANIASRLQSLTRDFGHDVILSGETRRRLNGMKNIKSLGQSRVKGKTEPIEIFTLAKK